MADSKEARLAAIPLKGCKWCGRNSKFDNPFHRHALSEEPGLPMRVTRASECKPCFNAIGIQSGGDPDYKKSLPKDPTPEWQQEQLARTKVWERMYNDSESGRVRMEDRGLEESASVTNSTSSVTISIKTKKMKIYLKHIFVNIYVYIYIYIK